MICKNSDFYSDCITVHAYVPSNGICRGFAFKFRKFTPENLYFSTSDTVCAPAAHSLIKPEENPEAAIPTNFPVSPGAVPAAGAAVPTDFPVLPDAVPAADSMDGAPARSNSAHPPPTPYIQRFRPSVHPEAVHTIHHFQEDAAVCWFPPDSLLFLHRENLFSENFPPSPFLLLWIRCPRPPPSYRSSVYPSFPFQPDKPSAIFPVPVLSVFPERSDPDIHHRWDSLHTPAHHRPLPRKAASAYMQPDKDS